MHLRAKRLERKIAALSVAILVAILGVGLLALSGYNAFKEVTTPALAALYMGLALFAISGVLLYVGTRKTVLKYGLDRRAKAEARS